MIKIFTKKLLKSQNELLNVIGRRYMKDGLVSTSHGVQHKVLFVVIATVYRLKTRQAALTQCLEQSIHLEGI